MSIGQKVPVSTLKRAAFGILGAGINKLAAIQNYKTGIMQFLKNLFGRESNKQQGPSNRIRLSKVSIKAFPKFDALLEDGKIRFDSTGRLRYLHGAPVGDMILIRVNKDGTPIYKESAEEWFDPESQKAKDFVWI